MIIPDYLRPNQKKKALQQQQEIAEEKKRYEQIASDIIKVLIEKNLKVGDFDIVVKIINMRFGQSFNQKEIKSLIEDYGEKKEVDKKGD